MIKDELQVLAQAILNEVEGYEFYRMAANSAKGASKAAFEMLAEEEQKHAEYLRTLSDRILESEDDKLTLAYELEPPSPEIYRWEKLDVKDASLAMTVFGIATQMEKDSVAFYEEALAKSTIPAAKELYKILIQWEKVHLDQFTEQYRIARQDWWADQQFAPF